LSYYVIIYYLKRLLLLCLPALAGLYIAKNGSDNSKNIGRIGLIALATVLFIAWPVLTFFTFMGFAIGGGNPTFFSNPKAGALCHFPPPFGSYY